MKWELALKLWEVPDISRCASTWRSRNTSSDPLSRLWMNSQVVGIAACLHRSWCACVFTLSADGGICAECRPAESLLRQRQAGGRADAGRELLVVVQLWPWRRLWRTSVCQSTAGGEQGETQKGKRLSTNDEDGPQLAQEMGPRGEDHTYPAGARECYSDCSLNLIRCLASQHDLRVSLMVWVVFYFEMRMSEVQKSSTNGWKNSG